jgi:hypothetical protein
MGRLGVGLGALVLFALIFVLVWLFLRDQQRRAVIRAEKGASWQMYHYTEGGNTIVVVRRVAELPSGELHVYGEPKRVETISDTDPNWNDKFQAAKRRGIAEAEELNIPA